LIHLNIEHRDDGSIRMESSDAWFIVAMHELPRLLEEERGDAVNERLLSNPSDDPEHQADWEKHVHPELFELIASATEIVRRDLASLEATDTGVAVEIPKKSVTAWMSALNVARHVVACELGLNSGDPEEWEWSEEDNERNLLLLKYELFTILQGRLIDKVNPPPEDFQDPRFPEIPDDLSGLDELDDSQGD
jgi:hypothetical protein